MLILSFGGCSSRMINCQSVHKQVCTFKYRIIEPTDQVMFNSQNTYKNRVIKHVYFRHSTVHFIPAELFTAFDNLEKLWMDGIELEDLRPKTFALAKRLNYLDLGSNNIGLIPEDAFQGAYNLKFLDLCCGKVSEIHKNAFSGLTSLEHIVLCGNQIKSLHKETFNELTSLNEVDLLGNQLEFLHKETFTNNLELLEIYLNKNRIQIMSSTMFSHLSKLNALMLSGNQCIDINYSSKAHRKFSTVESDLATCSKNYTLREEFAENLERFQYLSKRTSLIEDNSLSDSNK